MCFCSTLEECPESVLFALVDGSIGEGLDGGSGPVADADAVTGSMRWPIFEAAVGSGSKTGSGASGTAAGATGARGRGSSALCTTGVFATCLFGTGLGARSILVGEKVLVGDLVGTAIWADLGL